MEAAVVGDPGGAPAGAVGGGAVVVAGVMVVEEVMVDDVVEVDEVVEDGVVVDDVVGGWVVVGRGGARVVAGVGVSTMVARGVGPGRTRM